MKIQWLFLVLGGIGMGLLLFTLKAWNDYEESTRKACYPGMVEKTDQNMILCTDGEKRWVMKIK